MMQSRYDIFISYKRKSLPTANNLYYRLTTRGYSTFFDLEEMGRDNFNTQLLHYIENAKDVFVILEEGSLDACKRDDWEKDWFCYEIAFALEKKKNIIPILLNGYKMPSEDFFPDKLKEFHLKQAPEFNFTFFEAYLDKLVEKEYLLSKPNLQDKATSVFKFYSNENCQVFKEGKLVCSLEGMSDEPYYLPVPRKGDYRFKVVKDASGDSKIIDERIDAIEEKKVQITWERRFRLAEKMADLFRKKPIITISISIAFALLVVAIPVGLWKSSHSTIMPIEMPSDIDIPIVLPTTSQSPENDAQTIAPKKGKSSMDSTFIQCVPVDLGLPSGTLWGDRNVGANSIYDKGDLYAWGEVEPKTEYLDTNYRVKSNPFNIASTKLDAAYILLGENWRIPTVDQYQELIDNCEWCWYNNDSVFGYRVISTRTNNEILLPVNGMLGAGLNPQYGYYWTSERSSNSSKKNYAKEFYFSDEKYRFGDGLRYRGQGIRAVYKNGRP